MSKDIDLTEILKNCPRDEKFYSYIFGEDTYFMGVSSHQGDAKPIFIYGKYRFTHIIYKICTLCVFWLFYSLACIDL